jgi:probable O-glycosylation ligase (exosortase A-associated)
MRDLIVVGLVLLGSLCALRRPWIGIMTWTWVSMMNPHRFTYGFAYDMPVAAMAAASTLLGLLISKEERSSPFKGTPVGVLVAFMVWITISWLLGMDVAGDYPQWNKVMKVLFMILVALAVLHTKEHVMALVWVAAGSLALLGAKGGLFTVATGGGYRVYGPPGTFIEDNNEFAVALIMTIPLLRFLQLQVTNKWGARVLGLVMVLCAASAVGSHSRGGLLGISAMGLMLWLRGKNRVRNGLLLVVFAAAMLSFMPDHWFQRMETIETYQEDTSAMSRISAWWCAWNLQRDYPFGVGFNAVRPELFAKYSPYPDLIQAAHSIYFQILGHHGWIGLILYLSLGVLTWRWAGWLRKNAAHIPAARWCADLGSLVQVSMVGYAVGGAFLSLAYFDLPYNLLMLVVLARVWVMRKAWLKEPAPSSRFRVPGAAPVLSPMKP